LRQGEKRIPAPVLTGNVTSPHFDKIFWWGFLQESVRFFICGQKFSSQNKILLA
jgi:hypothetical protein